MTTGYDERLCGWVSQNEHQVCRDLWPLWKFTYISPLQRDPSGVRWSVWFIFWILACFYCQPSWFLYNESMYKVATVAEFEVRHELNKQDWQNNKQHLVYCHGWMPNLQKAEAESMLYYGTILQWGSFTHLVERWLCWTLSIGVFHHGRGNNLSSLW